LSNNDLIKIPKLKDGVDLADALRKLLDFVITIVGLLK
jgi:hypothetical protein